MLWAFTGWLCGSRQRNDSPCILNSINHGVCDRIVIPGTYVRPHRHPHTFELLLPLRGRFV
ncbi:hypothetical protein B8052_25125, partial [Klebsiella pneumoniae]